ncbi:MAG: hypothetical protein ACI3ZY_14730 [Parabacteroides sp.]
MSMRAIYKGGFYSVNNTLYEVEILKDGYEGDVNEIAFCEDPLTIEWTEVDKLEPVMSSSARIQLFSDSDRQFVGLYTVETGSVRMDVYRDGSLYWSGTIDTELYEEPYAYIAERPSMRPCRGLYARAHSATTSGTPPSLIHFRSNTTISV